MNVSVTKVDSSTNVSLTKGASQQSINDALALSLQYKNSASYSAESALNSANSASSSAANASLDRASASASATSANTSALNASASASTASTKADEASTSATNASNSASDASDSADSASSSALSASSSASSALGYKNTTEGYMTTTEGYKNSASSSASSASASSSSASGYATSASNSATTATTQAGIATTKAGEASTSASNAATSESNALSYKNSASASATSASNSASSASTSAETATTKASDAEGFATDAQNARDAILNMEVATGDAGTDVTWDGTTLTVPQGDAGAGIITGGTTNQVLAKNSNTDYDTKWYSVQDTLVSGTNIKTVNSTSLLGSGNIAVQPTLVSGTNIKSINSSSILTSGNLDLVAKVSSTDNAIVRFDGTSGAVQNSSVFIDDSGKVGIGTSSDVNFKTTIDGGATLSPLYLKTTGTNAYMYLKDGGTSDYQVAIGSNSGALRLVTAGNERMRIDSSGNVGIGVTPSAWITTAESRQVLQVKNASFSGTPTNVSIGSNYYRNSSYESIYLTNANASYYIQHAGSHNWYTAPSGTAGNTITWTTAMTLASSGNLLVGTATDNGVNKLQVNGSISATNVYTETTVTVSVAAGATITQVFTFADRQSSYMVKAHITGINQDLYAFAIYHTSNDFNITPIIASKSVGDYSVGTIDLQIKNNLSPWILSIGNGNAGQCVVTNGDSVARTLTIVIKKLI